MTAPPATEHVDVLIVGAGLSGIAAAVHLQKECPGKTSAIIESRECSGGTWDLFRYPGIRSDSDMFSLAYSFKPWTRPEAIAGAPAILEYLRDAARENGLEARIRFGHRLVRADWDSRSAQWQVRIERGASLPPLQLSCRFLMMCTGYYAYDRAHRPAFVGEAQFTGPIVHPQFWPDGLDVAGKRVLLIGSGATAVTLAPALADQGAQVTLVQRSPGYVVARPSVDRFANWLRRILPDGMGLRLARAKYLARDLLFYQLARRFPSVARRLLLVLAKRELGAGIAIAPHFSPAYRPWAQRLCLDPDGQLFARVRSGAVGMETGNIESFTASGVRLESGREFPADIIVTATGLHMELLSGVSLTVDGCAVSLADTVGYKGCMFSGVPNLVSVFGYTSAAWTLKAELICEYACRLLAFMERGRFDYCVAPTPTIESDAPGMMNLESGYVLRALPSLPRQGRHKPWKALDNYPSDILLLRRARVDDGALQFNRREKPSTRPGP